MITVQINEAALQQLQQRLAGMAPRIVAEVYDALKPLVYQSLLNTIPKYFAGSGGSNSTMLTSRSGDLMNSVLQSIQTTVDNDGLKVSIGSNLKYAAIHEYGGYAGRRGPFKKKDGKRPYLPARPYLHPAIYELQQALPALLEQAIQQVQVEQ
ncbi:MAG TPA: phage virion morphogenesis protein [Candidatus Angelobacter sp.]|nr:phage virion morphogenesis protein [Candidatus Angelobacter sp.]